MVGFKNKTKSISNNFSFQKNKISKIKKMLPNKYIQIRNLKIKNKKNN